jgi:CHASE3 domain sensor protein
MIAASALLALIIGGAFAILLLAIGDLRGAERRSRHAQDVLVAANHLERLLLDLETGQRGFVITREERFLEPWRRARRAFPQRAAALLGSPVAAATMSVSSFTTPSCFSGRERRRAACDLTQLVAWRRLIQR